MQPPRSTEPTGSAHEIALALLLALLGSACSPPPATSSETDAQDLPDLPTADMPAESSEYEGILIGFAYGAVPSRFVTCDTGEFWELSNQYNGPDWRWMGSCDGVFVRVRGQLDRSVDPPVVILGDVLEQRWCEPGVCVGNCYPDYDSCYEENWISYPCDPLSVGIEDCGAPDGRCNPVHFKATELAGWMGTVCVDAIGKGEAGDPCEYPSEPREVDTCLHGLRCWNPEGDVTKPGICVSYCDVAGEEGPVCDGTCVQCSGDDRGLCMHGCSGDDCNVGAFC